MISVIAVLLAFSKSHAGPARICDYVVGFGSLCCGPDTHQIEQLENYLKANPDLIRADSRSRGKEGEKEYCLHVKNHGDLLAVKAHLTRIVSLKSKKPDLPAGGLVDCFAPKPSPVCRDSDWKVGKPK